ncbi:GntP family permease [Selenomonas caprae]|uniref:GntP family permease n=1 Tax=Selenomonas caprae TaxID=2606905 RepID=A0A5D6WNH5_9FIRM|nr:GntP family permease [Selenomonas caprae]TYZ29473.1 GntP family permease [Selenomonas caprae]
MTGISLFVVFALAIVVMIVAISKFNIHPFLSLMGTSLLLAIVVQLPLAKIPGIIGAGFSGTFSSIGIVIILGALIGLILERTGAAIRLADVVIRCVGEKHPELAIMLMGWIVSIPVFCDSGFVILNPIRKALCKKLQQVSPVAMAVALSSGLYVAHVFIPPTPGPIAAAGSLGLADNLAAVILMGVVVSIPALLAGYVFVRYISGQNIPSAESDTEQGAEETAKSYDELVAEYGKLPGAWASFAPIVMPIVFMALGSLVSMMKLAGPIAELLKFLGTPIIALAIGVLFAVLLLSSTQKLGQFRAITEEALKTVGPILFITAAGGVLGKVITAAGFVEFMKENAAFLATVGIFFPFIISAILKTAQGSSTVAITTTAGILGMFSDSASMMSALGLNTEMAALLTVMAIGAGAMTVSHANDSYFWVVTNFSGMEPQAGYRTQTMMTLVVGVVSMLAIWLLSLILLG